MWGLVCPVLAATRFLSERLTGLATLASGVVSFLAIHVLIGQFEQRSGTHLRLERPTGADPDERRSFGDREDLRDDDLDVVRADAGRDDRHALAPVASGDRGELTVLSLELDRIEARGDPGGSVLVPGEEDVLGQVSRSESDVVLPFPFWDRYPAISRAFDAGFRVRQSLSLAHVAASLARNSAEDRPLFVRESSVAERG